MLISFAIPCYRSEHTVESVINEIIETVSERPDMDYEIIAVNDASPDHVWDVLERLSDSNPKIIAIDLARNVGKHAALMAAFSAISGDLVVTVDDDGQCPIDRLWDLIEPLNDNFDVAMARYPTKTQSRFKNFGSRVNNAMVRYLIGKPKDMVFTNFIARKRFVCDEIIKYTNPYPYLEGLTLRTTDKIAMIPMEERTRVEGASGYTFRKSLALWLNGCTAFSVKPLRLATLLGIIFACVGFVMGIVMIISKLLNPDMVAGYASTMVAILFIGGIVMLLLGILGEYIGRIYMCINDSPQYVIRKKKN